MTKKNIDSNLVADPINLGNIDVLLQAVLAGPRPMEETPNEWRIRVQKYALEIASQVYS